MTEPLTLHTAEETLEAVQTGRHASYPAYKPSGVQWLGDVPEHWEVKRLKFLAHLANTKVEADEETQKPYIGMEHIESWTGKLRLSDDVFVPVGVSNVFRSGDVLFGKLRPYLAKATTIDFDGLCSSELMVLRSKGLNRRFLLYTLLSDGFIRLVNSSTYGSKMPRANWEFIGGMLAPVPPLEEQQAVVCFLDEETQRIDDLIEAKRDLLDLFKEKRQAVITYAVTRGLDPAAKLKPSGVQWLGDVPERWEVLALRRHLRSIEQGWSPIAEDRPPVNDEWGVLKLSAVKDGRFLPEEAKTLSPGTSPILGLEVHDGDLLITRGNTPGLVGAVCVVSNTPSRLLLSDLVYRLKIDESRLVPEYLAYWLRSKPGRYEITRDARGSSQSMVKISQAHIRNWITLTPSLDEQREVTKYLDAETSKIDNLTRNLENHITLFQEYRSAIISAAVTGKIDVRGLRC